MTIIDQLLYIYPDLDFSDTVIVGDAGVEVWNDPRPQPTQVELDAAVIPAKRAKLTKDIDTITAAKIAGLFSKEPHSIELIVKQQNAQARVSELQELEAVGLKRLTELQDIEISGGTLTSSEQAEKQTLLAGVLSAAEQAEKTATQNAFTLIKSIRLHGKILKIDLLTSDPDTFDINTGWPV